MGASSLDLYLAEIQKMQLPILSRSEEKELALRIRAGDEDAVEELVKHNLRYVISVAKGFQHRGMDIEDLVAAGNEGLLIAARKFDPGFGTRFTTYAKNWIKQKILELLARCGRIVKVPDAIASKRSMYRILQQKAALNGHKLSKREVAEVLSLSEGNVELVMQSNSSVSLDAPLHQDKSSGEKVYSRICDERQEGVHQDWLDIEGDMYWRGRIFSELERQGYDRRAGEILILYFGLEGEPLSLEEIGRRLGITRERVRQIRERTFAQLRLAFNENGNGSGSSVKGNGRLPHVK